MITKTKQEVHIHIWRESWDPNERKCNCGALLVSGEEYQRRKEEWDAYFTMVSESPSFKDYLLARQGDQEAIKRANQRLEENEYIPKPKFPDPETWTKYILP